MKKKYTILMGDIIKSRSTDMSELNQKFNKTIKSANLIFKKKIISPLTITLGDEFQGVVCNLEDAFLIAHKLRIEMLGKDIGCRFLIGSGIIQTKIQSDSSWNMMGEGLIESREKLNNKSDPNCYRFLLEKSVQETGIEHLLDSLGRSMTEIESGWTKTQLEYTRISLLNDDQSGTAIAKKLKISSNTLSKVKKSAHFGVYQDHLCAISNYLKKDSAYGVDL